MPVGYPLLQGECMGGGVGGWAPHKTRSPAGEEGVHHKASPETARPHLALPMGPLRASGTLSSGRPNRQVRRWHDAVVTERAALKRGPRGSWCPPATSARAGRRDGGWAPLNFPTGRRDQGVGWLPPRGNSIPPQRAFPNYRMHTSAVEGFSHLPGKAGRGGRKLGEIPIFAGGRGGFLQKSWFVV